MPTTTPVEVLVGKQDHYQGIIVDAEQLPSDAEAFAQRLKFSLQEWRRKKQRGIWLKLPTNKAYLVGKAVEAGFELHHAEKGYVMLTKWLPLNEENKLPENASHQVGIGAFVLNERREMLLVQEKSGPLKGKGIWKMPTGLCNQGEDVTEAAVREVQEECGIAVEVDCILAFRQSHGFAFGKSDLFFLVAMRAAGSLELRMQEDELDAVCWMPLEEAAQLPIMTQGPMFVKMWESCLAWAGGYKNGWTAQRLGNTFNPRNDLLCYAPLEQVPKL